MPVETAVCPSCRATVLKAKFCSECGVDMESKSVQDLQNELTTSKTRITELEAELEQERTKGKKEGEGNGNPGNPATPTSDGGGGNGGGKGKRGGIRSALSS